MTTNYDHDFPEPGDWESTTVAASPVLGDLYVRISKVGGGTQGRRYAGAWHYRVESRDSSATLAEGSDLYTGSLRSHHEAATEVVAFLEDSIPE